MCADPKSVKIQLSHQSYLGSACAKDAQRTLMKLNPGATQLQFLDADVHEGNFYPYEGLHIDFCL